MLISEEDWRAIRDAISYLHTGHAGVHQERPQDTRRRVRRGTSLVNWRLVFTKQAQRREEDSAVRPQGRSIPAAGHPPGRPLQNSPPYEKLVGSFRRFLQPPASR